MASIDWKHCNIIEYKFYNVLLPFLKDVAKELRPYISLNWWHVILLFDNFQCILFIFDLMWLFDNVNVKINSCELKYSMN